MKLQGAIHIHSDCTVTWFPDSPSSVKQFAVITKETNQIFVQRESSRERLAFHGWSKTESTGWLFGTQNWTGTEKGSCWLKEKESHDKCGMEPTELIKSWQNILEDSVAIKSSSASIRSHQLLNHRFEGRTYGDCFKSDYYIYKWTLFLIFCDIKTSQSL